MSQQQTVIDHDDAPPAADPRRYPIEPALIAIDRSGTRRGDIAKRAGINLTRQIRAGDVNADQADRLAVACGLHPRDIWPEWDDYAAASVG